MTSTQTISFRVQNYPLMGQGDWGDNWLGKNVQFNFNGSKVIGEVVETERHFLANGIHDILTVEVIDKNRQFKIQAHRQAFRRLE